MVALMIYSERELLCAVVVKKNWDMGLYPYAEGQESKGVLSSRNKPGPHNPVGDAVDTFGMS